MPIDASATSGPARHRLADRAAFPGSRARDCSSSTRQHAELARTLERHFDHADGDVRFLLDVEADHRAVVHLVDVVAGEHQHVQRPVRANQVHVLPQRVRGALVPLGAAALLRGNGLDELAEFAAQEAPALADVLDQRVGLVLRQHRDLADARVEAVRQHEIDDAELAAERRGGLAAILGELLEPLAAPARHDDGERAAGQAAQVSTRRTMRCCSVDIRRLSDEYRLRQDVTESKRRWIVAAVHQYKASNYSVDFILVFDA